MSDAHQHFNDIAGDYDMWKRKNWYYHRKLKEFYREYIPENSLVLEIGCGTGDVLAALKPKRGVGVDISESMIALARGKYSHNGNLEFRALDITTALPDEPFDYIAVPDVLEHVPDTAGFLDALCRTAHQGTRIILSVANPIYEPILDIAERLDMKMPEGPHERLPMNDMEALFESHGFTRIDSGYRMLIPKPLPGADWVNARFHRWPLIRRLGWVVFWILRRQS